MPNKERVDASTSIARFSGLLFWVLLGAASLVFFLASKYAFIGGLLFAASVIGGATAILRIMRAKAK